MNNKLKLIIAIIVLIIAIIFVKSLFKENPPVPVTAKISLIGDELIVMHQNDVFVDPGYEIVETTNENNFYMNVDGYVNTNKSGSYDLTYSLYSKNGVLVDEVVRQVIVLDDALSNVSVYLKGYEDEYYFPNTYIDNGAEAYDKDKDITDQMVVDNTVQENEVGTYIVRYQVYNNNDLVETTRNVHIVNYDIERSIDEKNQVITLTIKCEGYSHTIIPDGTEVYSKYISISYDHIGSYVFDIYLDSGSHKKYTVDIKSMPEEKVEPTATTKPKIPDVKITGSCTLLSSNNKTKVTMKVNTPGQVTRYIINGMQFKGNTFVLNGTIAKATVIAFNVANKPYAIKCENITSTTSPWTGGIQNINEGKLGWFPCNTNVSGANKELDEQIKKYGERTRAAVATAATYLANFRYNVQYFWAGKYDQKGLNPRWGCEAGVVEYQYCSVKTGPSTCQWGLDCTGFTKWAYVQAGFPANIIPRSSQEQSAWGTFAASKHLYQFGAGDAANYIKAGDLVATPLVHVGVVIGVDGSRIQVAHESGGIKVTYLSKSTGKSMNDNGDFTHFVLMDEFYKMYGKS